MALKIDDIAAAVDDFKLDEDKVVALLGTIHTELLAALAAADQTAAIQAVLDKMTAAKTELTDAETANPDPATPAPAPAA